MYTYDNVIELPYQDTHIKKFQLYVHKQKWAELFNQDDLRFLKHKKYILHDLQHDLYGVILKSSSWNYPSLKHDYVVSHRIKNIHFVKHHCYFEYEEDVIKFLCTDDYDEENEDINTDCAIIISPYYKNIMHIALNHAIVKQIILSFYVALLAYKVQFKSININDMYIDEKMKQCTIKYKLSKPYTLKTNTILKIGCFVNTEILYQHSGENYKQLYVIIISVLQQFNKPCLQNLIELIQDFNANDEHVIHPMKVLDCILSQVDCLVLS
jgi:hypothetical protein